MAGDGTSHVEQIHLPFAMEATMLDGQFRAISLKCGILGRAGQCNGERTA